MRRQCEPLDPAATAGNGIARKELFTYKLRDCPGRREDVAAGEAVIEKTRYVAPGHRCDARRAIACFHEHSCSSYLKAVHRGIFVVSPSSYDPAKAGRFRRTKKTYSGPTAYPRHRGGSRRDL